MNLLLVVALAAAPAAEPGYGSGTLDLPKLASTPDATLAQQVLACAKSYGVAKIVRKGEAAPLWSPAAASPSALDGTSRAERIALLSVLGRRMAGSEVDILVPLPEGKGQPVSVTWEGDGTVTFESGAAVGALVDDAMTVEKLKKQFAVGEFLEGDAKWDGATLSAVQQALASLSKEELALVKGLHFRRMKVEGIHRAKYERGDDTNWVNLYDATFLFAQEQFTGPVASPRPEALIPLLHELGHAIADARFREKGLVNKAAADAFKAKPDDQALYKEADRLVKQMLANDRANQQGRPVEKAFAAVFPPKRSPTRYGKGSAKEHFAECFTLYKNDPDALKRVSPEAFEWFASGKHVEISGKALDP
jgi:hypothetical protein